jgi:hypothetical protein
VHVEVPERIGLLYADWMCPPPEFAWYQAYPDSAASSFPNEYRVAVFARAAYSRSASVGNRYAFPTFFDSQATNALTSCQLSKPPDADHLVQSPENATNGRVDASIPILSRRRILPQFCSPSP